MPKCKKCGKNSFWTVDVITKVCRACKSKKKIPGKIVGKSVGKNILLLGTLTGLIAGFYISLLIFIPDYFFGANIFGGTRERIIIRILGFLFPFIVPTASILTVYLLKSFFKPNLVHLISVCLITMVPVLTIIMGEADDIHIISALGGLVGFISSIPFVLFYLIIDSTSHLILKNILVFFAGCISGQYVSVFLQLMLKIYIVGGFAVNIGEPAAWEIKYFLIPFFAYAGGTIAGSFMIAKHSVSHHMVLSIFVGAVFLFRDLSSLLTMPLWFVLPHIAIAYIPMGWLGWKLTGQDK